MQHEVLVHAAAVAPVEVVALRGEVAVRTAEVTAEKVDVQVGPVLEKVLLVGVAVPHRLEELRLEGQVVGIDLVGIGIEPLEVARAPPRQQGGKCERQGPFEKVSKIHGPSFFRS